MPDNDAKNALSILAARYKGESHVIYALQVEPHDDDEHGCDAIDLLARYLEDAHTRKYGYEGDQ